MESKHPKPKVIFVDVDNTLIINDEPNQKLVEWMIKKKAEGYQLILWSMAGKDHAVRVAITCGVSFLFDDIISKPGYIVDDVGWTWTMHTEVLSPDMKIIKKKKKPVFNNGAAMRRKRDRSRSKL